MGQVQERSDQEIAPMAGRGESGDPLLKRLVDLAKLGWEANLVLYSNGAFLSGQLISGAKFRVALAESIRARRPDLSAPGSEFDEIVASAVAAEDPPTEEADLEVPEPRFIHLADVRVFGQAEVSAPFLRLRLPAVSGFWIEAKTRP